MAITAHLPGLATHRIPSTEPILSGLIRLDNCEAEVPFL
jgi:hypothetical protein